MKPIKRIVIIAAVLAVFIVAVSILVGVMMNATAGIERHKASYTVTDDYGHTVAVPSHPARVVSLSPAVTEIIYALGAEELLVGRTDFCTYPPEVADIPSIGGISNLNIEKILSLNPDLVISGSMVGKKVTDQMDAMGTPMVCVIEKPRFEALYDNITAIGKLVGKEQEADSLCNALTARCNEELGMRNEELADSSNNSTFNNQHSSFTPSVYYVVGFGAGGNFTAGGNTFINDIIRMAGGRNIAEDVEGWSYSLEALVKEDPDYIIVRREDSAAFCGMKPYNRLRAVREGHVIGIESGTFDLQVPRNIDAILYLRKRMNQ
ncbi:MAG: ABC transporter substrate-binding protein [Bacteroidales bacterium]|nr:ABC transporter substrate-binding protein [Bacteroidales bacterium]